MTPRRATVPALAKINLALEVLGRRADGFHDLRTVFQTISLADELTLEWTPGAARDVVLESSIDIPDNLVTRAARLVLDEVNAAGALRLRLTKRIPMGGGLGGGSTDAAAVLLALPVLAGYTLPADRINALAAALGSDVPFLLTGGTALGLGRGTEIYPLPDAPPAAAVLVCPPVHVATAGAYRALERPVNALTSEGWSPKMGGSWSLAWHVGAELPSAVWSSFCHNDFEPVVFRAHPRLEAIKQQLERAGAVAALMTGSGAAVFGLFSSEAEAGAAAGQFENAFRISLVSRRHYQRLWREALREHIAEGSETWPPRSRYA